MGGGASVGVASLLTLKARHLLLASGRRRAPHPLVGEFPLALSAYPALCAEIEQLTRLRQDEGFRAVMRVVEEIARLDEERRRGNEFKIVRATATLSRLMARLVAGVRTWESDALFNEKRIAEEDTIPTVEQQPDDILHNHIIVH